MKCYTIRLKGKVQGVFFRIGTKAVADQLKIKGFVKNEMDGSLYLEAQGNEQMIEQFLDWCKEGPEDASVENVDVMVADKAAYSNFVIKK